MMRALSSLWFPWCGNTSLKSHTQTHIHAHIRFTHNAHRHGRLTRHPCHPSRLTVARDTDDVCNVYRGGQSEAGGGGQ